MIRKLCFTLLLAYTCAAFSTLAAAAEFDHSHKNWSQVLSQYQNAAGLVNYEKLKKDAKAENHLFNQYLNSLSSLPFDQYEKMSKTQQMAILINAYNAYTFKLIVDNYPVGSIKDIGGIFSSPWKKKFFKFLGGKIESIDPIEHEWLRPKYKDYRIHAAVNCASISCPPLRNEAYVADKLNAQLDEQMRLWFSDSSRNTFDHKTGKIQISKIFDWYEDDFEKWGGGIKKVIAKYGPEAAQEALKKNGDIDYMDYDWNLNEVKSKS